MLAIHNISIMMWILYIDRKQYWKWTINSGANAHDKRTVSENSDRLDSWASSYIGEEMSQFSSHSPYSVSDSATVSQCDNFCCYMYLLCLKLYMTSQRWRVFFLFFLLFFWWWWWWGGGGGGALISSVFSLVFGVVYWSRPPRVLQRFTVLLSYRCYLKEKKDIFHLVNWR